MRDEKPMFGAKSERLDRLVSHVLDESEINEQGAPTASLDALAESIGGWIGRYKLLQVLGEGGMGVVYLAEQNHPIRRQVALKVIKPGMDSKRVLARFEAEQQALALMEHPHVARVYDAGLTPSGRPYFIMEYVNGIPITEHCDKYRLTIEERLHLFLHVCEGVQHAHQKGIIHRDLKPSNILVVIQDQEMIPKVIDFGVARAISQPLTERTLYTEQGQMLGTPEYMSPEQADPSDQDIDTRTDVYSLGVVLYELLAGVLPFDPKTFRAGGIDHIRKVICEEDAKTPSTRLSRTSVEESTESARRRQTDIRTLQRKLRGDLDWITLKAMEKDRTRRYATLDALATDIRNHLTHQPVSAAPPGTLYRAKKFVRRHQQAMAACGAALVLLMGATWTTQMYIRASREHTRSEAFEQERRLAEAQEAFGAKKWIDAISKIEPLMASPHVGRKARLLHAKLLLEQNGLAAAVPKLQALLDESDDVAGQAHFLLANIYYEGDPRSPGETEEYRQLWDQHRKRAQQLIGKSAQYYFLQAKATPNVKETLELFARALEIDEQHYDSLRERAYIYYAQQDYGKMLRDADRMRGIQPDSPQAYLLSAIALRELGRFDEAIQDHAEAIRLAPDDPEFYVARWQTYTRMRRHEEALQDIRRCVELAPEDLLHPVRLYASLTALGRHDEADRQYRDYVERPDLDRGFGINLMGRESKILFWSQLGKVTFDHLEAGIRPYPPNQPPFGAAFGAIYYAELVHEALQRDGRRLVTQAFHPAWSPD